MAGNHGKRKRTFSECDEKASQQILNFIVQAFNALKNRKPFLERDFTKSSMILPMQYNNQIVKRICEFSILIPMERKGAINWNQNIRALLPMHVEDDGNSLAHSVSVYIFGIQDKAQHLRQLIYQMMFMEKQGQGEIYNRWTADRYQTITALQRYPTSCQEENARSWDYYLGNAQHRNRDPFTGKYFQLEAIHIFILSNVIGRPIIVYTRCESSNEKELANAIRYEGVYLPILRINSSFEKSPVLVGYEGNRFIPLFSTENQDLDIYTHKSYPHSQHCAPLVRKDFTKIPVRFLLPRENENIFHLFQTFLDMVKIPTEIPQQDISAAILKFKAPNAQSIELLWSMLDAVKNYSNEDEQRPPLQYQQQPPLQHQQQPPLQHQQQPPLQHQQQPFIQQQQPLLQHQQQPFMQHCVRQKAGKCNNPASANSQGMCEPCYVKFQAVLANKKKRSPSSSAQQKDVQPQPAMDDYNRIGLCFQCNQRPSNTSYDKMCRKCFEDKIRNTKPGDDDVFANKPNDNAYESLEDYRKQNIPPNVPPNVPPNGPPKGNCNQCGKQYFRENAFGLCEDCFETIRKQQEEAEEKQRKNSEKKNQQHLSMPVENDNNPQQRAPGAYAGIAAYQQPQGISMPPMGSGYQAGAPGLAAGGDYEGSRGMQPVAAAQGGISGKPQAENDKLRKKIFCSVAGCDQNVRSIDDNQCEHHYNFNQQKQVEKKMCWNCNKNFADDNALGTCTVCVATQGNLIKEAQQEKQGNRKNLNVGRGPANFNEQAPPPQQPPTANVDLFSLPDLPQVQQPPPQAAPRKRADQQQPQNPNFQQGNYQAGYQGGPRPAQYNDVEMRSPNYGNPPHQQPNYGNPQQQQQPYYGNPPQVQGQVLASLPDLPQVRQQQQQPPQQNLSSVPTLYEGFGQSPHNYGHQEGQMKWQQQQIQQGKTCKFCNKPPTHGEYCQTCHDVKQLPKCGNPDKANCPNKVANKDEFMCHDCIKEQRDGLEKALNKGQNLPIQQQISAPGQPQLPIQQQPYAIPQQQNQSQYAIPSQQNQMPCMTRGCTGFAVPTTTLCDRCSKGQYPNFPQAYGMGAPPPQQQQYASGGMPSPQPQGGEEGFHPQAQKCKSFDCDFVGTFEYGGYCHGCFLEVTKHENERKTLGFQSQPPMGGNPMMMAIPPPNPVQSAPMFQQIPTKCRNPDCDMFGRADWNGLCSKCYQMNKVEPD